MKTNSKTRTPQRVGSLARGSDVWEVQFLTSSGWQTDRTLDSESLAIAHFFAIGKANVWTGHVRILHDGKTIKSTLHPNEKLCNSPGSGASPKEKTP